MIFISNKMMFLLMKCHFLKYKYQQIVLYFIKNNSKFKDFLK